MKMYKTQKRTSRKRKDVQKASDKSTGKMRKFEGNINMSKRFTIPPEIFGSGIAASTPFKNKDSKDNCNLENFNGLFNKCFNIRRSERLRNRTNQDKRDTIDENIPENLKNSSVEIKQPGHSSISENLNNILKLNSYETTNILNKSPSNCNQEKKNNKHSWKRSKSIFEEINQLYKKNKYLSKRPTEEFDGKFCSLLYKQLNKNFIFGQKTLLVSKSKIFSEIKNIENILLGKVKMVSKPPSKQREYYYDAEENDNDINWDYFSKSEWVYRTPPAQKIIPPKLDENQMQPAIIYSTKKHTQLFEIKNNHKVNLSDLEGKHIQLNHNTMNHIITTNNTMDMEIDKIPVERSTDSQNFDNVFNFSQPKQEEFMNVFSKPSKSFKREYREGTQAKRKLDEDLSQDMFSSCKLSDCGQPMNVNTTPNYKKKNYVPRNKTAFKLNVPQFESKSNFSQNEFDFMDADQVVGFDFKNMQKSNKVFDFK